MTDETKPPSEAPQATDLEKVIALRNKALEKTALAEVPPVTVIPQDRVQELNIDHPGHIKYASQKDGGKYVGCKLDFFEDAAAVNAFFKAQSNLIVIELLPAAPGFYILYTNQLEREEMELYLELQEAYVKVKDDLLRKRALARQEEEAALDKEEAELERLSTLGKKCEANHGKLEKMREERDALQAKATMLEARIAALEAKK